MTVKHIAAAFLAVGMYTHAPAADISTDRAAKPAIKLAPKPVRIILVGDSTMATRTGYGDALCARFQPSVTCINLARGGRSSASFRAEGLWSNVEALLRDGASFSASYVLIQFGHNDQPGKPGRSTDLVTQFPVNMARYAVEAKALGAVPVMVTPLTRRSFQGPVLENDLAPWAAATRAVAADQHVPLLELNADSNAVIQAMGEAEADTLAMAPPPANTATTRPAIPQASTGAVVAQDLNTQEPAGAAKTAFDRTHLGAKGARLFSGMVAHELMRAIPSLAANVKDSD